MIITNPNKMVIADVLKEKPDLYGPFWIATSLIFCLFAFGNLSGIFGTGSYSYDFIGSAASCVYGYSYKVFTARAYYSIFHT